jgi:hypothetical protein
MNTVSSEASPAGPGDAASLELAGDTAAEGETAGALAFFFLPFFVAGAGASTTAGASATGAAAEGMSAATGAMAGGDNAAGGVAAGGWAATGGVATGAAAGGVAG